MKDHNAIRKNRIFAAVRFIILLCIVVGLPLYIYMFHRDVLTGFRSIDDTVTFLRNYRSLSAPVYFAAEILQIVISILPGQLFQMAAGYLFGFIPGLIYTLIGAILGTVITFVLARVLGSDAIHLMLGEEKSRHYMTLLNSRKAYLITFLIYLIPGVPKDTVCYIAGISEMKMIPFVIISIAGRMPAMAASVVFGAMYMKRDYTGMIIVSVIVAIALLICILKRREIMGRIDRLYEKMH